MKRLALALGLLVASWGCHRPDEVRLKSSLISPSPRGLGKRVGSGQPTAGLRGIDNPTQVQGLVLWLDASRGVTISTGVSSWLDQSGQGNNFTQATGGQQPTFTAVSQGGRPTIGATATSQMTSPASAVTAQAARTVFAVLRPSATAAGQFYTNGPVSGSYGLAADSTQSIFESNQTTTASSGLTISAAFHVYEFSCDGITTDLPTLKVDGIPMTVSNAAGVGMGTETTGTSLLMTTPFNGGLLSEMEVYNSQLSAANAANVRAYLKAKYGTP